MSEKDRQPDDKRERMWIFEREYSRRDVLKGAAALGAAAGLSGILAACGGGSTSSSEGETPATTAAGATTSAAADTGGAETAAAGGPVTGGRLRVGHVGGGKAESFNPATGSTFIDASRYYNLYDPLVRVSPELENQPGLALEWNANSDSTQYEVKLRPDVVWHNGKDFTAADVIYTLGLMNDPKHIAHSSVSNIRVGEVKKVDDLTLSIPLKTPDARLADQFIQQNTVIVQDGYTDYANPVGTGAFKFVSFTVGERSLCARNENYWEEGKPYVDEWEDISISDNAARLNALLAGEIDMMSQLEFTQAKAQQESGDVQVIDAPSPAIQVILMAVDEGPFKDQRVREAFRLIPDRQGLINGALAGFASVGNDLAGSGLPYFADLPAREQDLEKAKSLLKAAGQEGMTVTLQTSTIVPGFVEAATLFAEQAKGAGVTVEVKKEDRERLLRHVAPVHAHSVRPVLLDRLGARGAGTRRRSSPMRSGTRRTSATRRTTRRSKTRSAPRTPMRRPTRWAAVQQTQYDEGGYIVWANQSIVDAAGNNVKGIVPSAFFNLGGWNYRDVWLES